MAHYKVGSFNSKGGTGTQAITGLGFTPKALILFTTMVGPATGFRASVLFGAGVATSPTDRFSVATYQADAVATSNTSRRSVNRALTVVQPNESLVWDVDLASFDADGFTLNWITDAVGSTNYIINYIAIGGDEVQAKVVTWTTPTTAVDKVVTGVGFKPDAVLNLSALTNGLASGAHAGMTMGVMDKDGNQWSMGYWSDDAEAPDSRRVSFTDAAMVSTELADSVAWRGAFKSMDADGFTLKYSAAAAYAVFVGSLCLRGAAAKVGSFLRPIQTGGQRLDGVGFRPKALLCCGHGNARNVQITSAIFSLGAADGVAQRNVAARDGDALSTSQAQGYQESVLITHLPPSGANTISDQATLASFDADGFTLNWSAIQTANDRALGYLALGDV